MIELIIAQFNDALATPFPDPQPYTPKIGGFAVTVCCCCPPSPIINTIARIELGKQRKSENFHDWIDHGSIHKLGPLGINIACVGHRSCIVITEIRQGGIGSACNLQLGDQIYFKNTEDPPMEVYNNFVSRVENCPFTFKVRRGSTVPRWIQEKVKECVQSRINAINK